MLVVTELPGVARQFCLQLSFEGPVCLSVPGEFIQGGDVLGSATVGRPRVGRVEREVKAPCEPFVLRSSVGWNWLSVVPARFLAG